jgi:hypothetical protein
LNKNLTRFLGILVIAALLGIFAEQVILLSSEPSLQYSEETEYYEVVSVRDTNGSLSTGFHHEIREFEPGHFNLTLPLLRSQMLIELNSSVSQVSAVWMLHFELPGDHEDTVEVVYGSDIEVRAGSETFFNRMPRYSFEFANFTTAGNTAVLDLTLEGDTLRSLNTTELHVSCESMVEASCDAYYSVNYAISFTINLEFARPKATPGFYLILSPSFMILGLFSVILLVMEVERMGITRNEDALRG